VEQKNWTHVKKFVGYYRYDSDTEQNILNDLYRNELRLYKNFFQPVMKLIKKGGFRGREAFCPRASNCLRLLVQSRMPKQNFLPPYLNFFGGARNPKIGEENCVET